MNADGSFASHDKVDHSQDEYVRYEGGKLITTNTVEGFYSIFKRGMKGVYQHVPRSTFTATLRSLISGIQTESHSGSTTLRTPIGR